MKVEGKSEFGTISLRNRNDIKINACNVVNAVDCHFKQSEEKGLELIVHHEEILEDYLDTEFDIRSWEEDIGN